MKRIKIASGDTGYTMVFQLMDREIGRPLDLTADGTAASFHFIGVSGEIFHLQCAVLFAALGVVSVEWPPVGLIDVGLYEGVFRVLFGNQKAVTVGEKVPFEITEALPCVDGTGNPSEQPQSWIVQNGRIYIANADHPNVYHAITITGDPDNPTIDIEDGVVMDGGLS